MINDSIQKELKNCCITKIQQFINARGKIETNTGNTLITFDSVFPQNILLTEKKITAAHQLISTLSKTHSVEDAYKVLHDAPELKGDFDALIGECIYIIDSIVAT